MIPAVSRKGGYGVDGWPYLASFILAASGLAATAVVCSRRRPAAAAMLGAAALVPAVPAVLGAHYVLRGKHALRDRLLDEVGWSGDEVVVDLGAGAGLLAVGAAHRTRGPVHAVDLFIGTDLSQNSATTLRSNATREGVAERLAIHRRDVRDTGLPDASVDVVLSTLCLHNLTDSSARRAALDEAARILRPGGTIVLSDLAHVDDEYSPHLRAAGFVISRTERAAGTFPPQRFLIARAP
jgi:SAM-dependent methyltransferase